MTWWVYMIEADNGALYTGITTDIARRFREHLGTTRGARFFNGRVPFGVVFLERQESRSAALIREAAIKKLRRVEKLKLKQDKVVFL